MWSYDVKQLRAACGLTQQELANHLGINKKIVADWEQGRQEPSARRYVELAKMATGEQTLRFLGRIGLDSQFLSRLKTMGIL